LSLKVWRISDRRHLETAFTGEGASSTGGRWNSKGNRVVYTSATLSLATLEKFVNIKIEHAGNSLVAIDVDIPDLVDIETVTKEKLSLLPWSNYPVLPDLASFGDEWITSGRTAVLCVSSAIIPVENNYLLNPLHPDFSQITIHSEKFFSFDRRMWK
jgi:RES domain-containing protein